MTEEKVKEIQPKSNKNEFKKDLSNEETQIKSELNIGQPFEFDKNETHSFNEWLKLSQAKPIQRNKESENKLQK